MIFYNILKWFKTNWPVVLLYILILYILIDLRCQSNESNRDLQNAKKTEIKGVEKDIEANEKETTGIIQGLSDKSKADKSKADKIKSKAHEKSIAADTTDLFMFSHITRK